MGEFTTQTVWNMDETRMKAVNYYLDEAEKSFIIWDLEGIYLYLLQVRRMISGKIRKKEYKEAGEMFAKIEEYRQSIDIDKDKEKQELRVKIYSKSEELYVYLNRLMVDHGMFFKGGDDPSRAALKR